MSELAADQIARLELMADGDQKWDLSENDREAIRALLTALEQSVKLQSHYASLLNMHDDGRRMVFHGPEAWMARLKTIAQGKPPLVFRDPDADPS